MPLTNRALDALACYGKALATLRSLKAERSSHECEFYEPSVTESDTGYFERGVPTRRNRAPLGFDESWCEPCKKREQVHQQVLVAKRNERVARQRMQYHVLKLARAGEGGRDAE